MDAPPKPTVTAERERPCEVKKTIFCRLLGVFATEPLIWQFYLLMINNMINNSKSTEKFIKENTNQLRLKLQNKKSEAETKFAQLLSKVLQTLFRLCCLYSGVSILVD